MRYSQQKWFSNRGKDAFTLLEVTGTIAVILLLAAVAIYQFVFSRCSILEQAANRELQILNSAYSSYLASGGTPVIGEGGHDDAVQAISNMQGTVNGIGPFVLSQGNVELEPCQGTPVPILLISGKFQTPSMDPGASPTATPDVSPSSTPTVTPSSTPTATPSGTAAPSGTSSPTPTPTATAYPVDALVWTNISTAEGTIYVGESTTGVANIANQSGTTALPVTASVTSTGSAAAVSAAGFTGTIPPGETVQVPFSVSGIAVGTQEIIITAHGPLNTAEQNCSVTVTEPPPPPTAYTFTLSNNGSPVIDNLVPTLPSGYEPDVDYPVTGSSSFYLFINSYNDNPAGFGSYPDYYKHSYFLAYPSPWGAPAIRREGGAVGVSDPAWYSDGWAPMPGSDEFVFSGSNTVKYTPYYGVYPTPVPTPVPPLPGQWVLINNSTGDIFYKLDAKYVSNGSVPVWFDPAAPSNGSFVEYIADVGLREKVTSNGGANWYHARFVSQAAPAGYVWRAY